MKLQTIGIDLGKTSFHLIGMDERGNVVLRRRFSRTQLVQFMSKLENLPCRYGSLLWLRYPRPNLEDARPLRAPHSGEVCSSVCEIEQERLQRRGGDC